MSATTFAARRARDLADEAAACTAEPSGEARFALSAGLLLSSGAVLAAHVAAAEAAARALARAGRTAEMHALVEWMRPELPEVFGAFAFISGLADACERQGVAAEAVARFRAASAEAAEARKRYDRTWLAVGPDGTFVRPEGFEEYPGAGPLRPAAPAQGAPARWLTLEDLARGVDVPD